MDVDPDEVKLGCAEDSEVVLRIEELLATPELLVEETAEELCCVVIEAS